MAAARASLALLCLQLLATSMCTLAQLQPPTVKYAPCDAGGEYTCSGAPGTADICCNKANFRCATRLDTGAPRCAVCPSICPDCNPGYTCGVDANGCRTCVEDTEGKDDSFVRAPPPSPPANVVAEASPAPPPPTRAAGQQQPPPAAVQRSPPPPHKTTTSVCSAAKPCPSGQLCDRGTCRADPCLAVRCTASKPKCTVNSSFQAQCVAAPKPPPSPRPRQPRSIGCQPACGKGFTCQASGSGSSKRWRCVKVQKATRRPKRSTRRALRLA